MTQAIEFIVPNGTGGRADKVLADAFPETSRSLIKRSIEIGKPSGKMVVSLNQSRSFLRGIVNC